MTDSLSETRPTIELKPYLRKKGLIAAICASVSFFLLYNHIPGINIPLNSIALAIAAVLMMPAIVKNQTLATTDTAGGS